MVAILEQCTHLSVLEIEGTLRAPVSSTLSRSVQARLSRGERRILLDLSQLTAIDAAGIGELIRVFNVTRAAGGALRVARANRRVLQLLNAAGVLSFLTPLSSPSTPGAARG